MLLLEMFSRFLEHLQATVCVVVQYHAHAADQHDAALELVHSKHGAHQNQDTIHLTIAAVHDVECHPNHHEYVYSVDADYR